MRRNFRGSFRAVFGDRQRGVYAQHLRTGRAGDNIDLFPKAVAEWADEHSDELSLLADEIRQTPNLIEE